MENYFRYKRFDEQILLDNLQTFLDTLASEGWEIVYYKENVSQTEEAGHPIYINLIILAGKKQETKVVL